MTLIDRPWTRVRKPVPIPEVYTVTDLQQMADVDFAELVVPSGAPRPVPRWAGGVGQVLAETQGK